MPLGINRFRIVLGHAPHRPDRPNLLQFTIKQHALGNRLSLEVIYDQPGRAFNADFLSWSYDLECWQPVHWENGWRGRDCPLRDCIHFPAFERDIVHVGSQTPMAGSILAALYERWTGYAGVEKIVIGQSLGGRKIYRLVMRHTGHLPGRPWRHYFACQHGGEYNAQWRMAGMADWLLSEAGRQFRDANECHFVFTVNPDCAVNGWQCMNAEGGDLQRWRAKGDDGGPDAAGYGIQPREAWLAQQDFEALMQTQPFDTVWSMHTWPGVVEPMVIPGDWLGKRFDGAWQDLRAVLLKHDTRGLCKPLKLAEIKSKTYKSWGHGPWQKYGVTSFGCEGASNIYTKEANLDSGCVLIRGFAEYCERFAV